MLYKTYCKTKAVNELVSSVSNSFNVWELHPIPFLQIHVCKLSKNSNNSKDIILIIIEINSNYYVYETNFTGRTRDVIPDVITP